MSPGADFVDHPAEPGRDTTTLLVGVLTRAATLSVVSGAQAVASMVAGLSALGRSLAETVEGRHMRDALERGRVPENLRLLFDRLGLGTLASASPPTPMLADFFDDVALVLAPDVAQAVDAALAGAGRGSGIGLLPSPEPVDPVDFVVGLWAFSGEVTATLADLMAAGPLRDRVTEADEQAGGPGRMLR